MKKIPIILLLLGLLTLCVGKAAELYADVFDPYAADEESAASDWEEGSVSAGDETGETAAVDATPQNVSPPQGIPETPPVFSGEELVSLEASKMHTRIRDLERRIDDLERADRYLDERIRNLDRLVDDLRRRR